jgi:imidazoleglycerol phosphate dehydratase HisB
MIVSNKNDTDAGYLRPIARPVLSRWRGINRFKDQTTPTIQIHSELPLSVSGESVWPTCDQLRDSKSGLHICKPTLKFFHSSAVQSALHLALF